MNKLLLSGKISYLTKMYKTFIIFILYVYNILYCTKITHQYQFIGSSYSVRQFTSIFFFNILYFILQNIYNDPCS